MIAYEFSCYDYETGSYSEATPKLDGGFDVTEYDFGDSLSADADDYGYDESRLDDEE